ncbi:MAG: metal-dependent hydrolase [Methanomicrobiales archaeon]|jgi:hypothetical protein
MITRHHLALAPICTLLISSSLLPFDPVLLVVVIAGSCAGAILPDFQMKKPKSPGLLTLPWLAAQFSRIICIPIMCTFYSVILPAPPNAIDKRMTHSLPGILFVFAAVAGISSLPLLFIRNGVVLSLVKMFLLGVILGLALHLMEDLCTRKGISPLFPFGSVSISGSIRPCNRTDPRIARFHAQHCSALIAFLTFRMTGLMPASLFEGVGLLVLCVILGSMIYLSDVSLTGVHTPVNIPRHPSPTPYPFSPRASP